MSTDTDTVLILRTCAADMTSYSGFRWPESGPVKAPDWSPKPTCGSGLHGWLWGEGDGSLGNWSPEARWLVVEASAAEVVDLGGKVKFPGGAVVYCGDRASATAYLAGRAPGRAIIGSTLMGGDRSTLLGGYGSTLTAGDGSTLTAGHRSTLMGGYGSTLTGGYGSTLTAGDGSTLTGGDDSTLTGGDDSTLLLRRWDGARWRWSTAYVGEDGILPGVPYRLDGEGRFVRADGVTA